MNAARGGQSSPRSSPFLAFALALTFACGQTSEPVSSADAAASPAPFVAPAVEAGAPAAHPIVLPPLAVIPFQKSDVITVSSGEATDYGGALLENAATGHLAVVFERFLSVEEFKAEMRIAELDSAGHFGPSERVAFSSGVVTAGPHVLVHGGTSFVYFMHGDPSKGTTRLARAAYERGAFGPAEDLVLGDTFAGNLAWPCPVAHDEEIVMAYDHYQEASHVASGDGHAFATSVQVGKGVQGRVASFADGSLAYTWQNGDAVNMSAFVRIRRESGNGAAWTPQVAITEKTNVHDVTPFRRIDGSVDLYYVSTQDAPGFRIIRRQLRSDGALGTEEILSADGAGSFTQPRPHRLGDGSVGLVMGVQVTSNVDTDTAFVRIPGDARP